MDPPPGGGARFAPPHGPDGGLYRAEPLGDRGSTGALPGAGSFLFPPTSPSRSGFRAYASYSWVTSMDTSPSSSMPSVIRLGRQQTVQSSVKVWRRPAVESTVSSFSSPQNAHPYVTFRILRANVS